MKLERDLREFIELLTLTKLNFSLPAACRLGFAPPTVAVDVARGEIFSDAQLRRGRPFSASAHRKVFALLGGGASGPSPPKT